MNSAFLICGFPRCRTMWLAHFLTVPGISYCTHEATEFAGSVEEFWSNADHWCFEAGVEIYGNSDSANLYGLRSILAEHPMTRTVWINRPMKEVAASMARIGSPMEERTIRHITMMRDLCWDYFDIVVNFDELVNLAACQEIWDHCLPGVPFDAARWVRLSRQRIGYSVENPIPKKEFTKFLGWAMREIDALREEGIRI